MSIHYKFKSNLTFDTLTFDGVQISVADLKKSIIKQKKLGKITDFELQVTNAQTKEVYISDNVLIPKNTSLIIARIPTNNATKKVFESQLDNVRSTKVDSKLDGSSLDLTQLKASEEEKIQAMMLQSTADYDPKSYYKLKPTSQVGEVPASYKCNRCKKGGHWIKNCPFSLSKESGEVKRNTGIPMSFREKKDTIEESVKPTKDIVMERTIPDELICGICKDLFVDAVMIPCCGSSFCDDCVRTALLESDESECPDCKEKGSSPASLIPNRFLRNSVNAFKNETGYSTEKKINMIPPQEAPEKEMISSNEVEKLEIEKKNTENLVKEEDEHNSDASALIISQKEFVDEKPELVQSDNINPISLNSQDEFNKNINIFEEEIPDKIKEKKPLLSLNIEMNNNPVPEVVIPTQQMQVNILTCESATLKPLRPFGQFPPLQPQILNAFDNVYNRIRPPMSHNPYHPIIRPRMDHVQTGTGGLYYHQPINMMNMNNNKKHVESTGIDNIYGGVAVNIGNGIIDDPLEAFNRIMEEKEKRRTKLRRSRSKERQKRWYHRSPSYDRRTRCVSKSSEKRLPRDEYINKGNNRENHLSLSSNRYHRRSNSILKSRSRSNTPPQKASRSPKSQRSGGGGADSRKRNDNTDKRSWNERRSVEHRSENAQYRNILMRQPSPPGSDSKYSSRTKQCRRRSHSKSPGLKTERKRSADSKRDENISKSKNAKKAATPPLVSNVIQDKTLQSEIQTSRKEEMASSSVPNAECSTETNSQSQSNSPVVNIPQKTESKKIEPLATNIEMNDDNDEVNDKQHQQKDSVKKEKKSKDKKRKKKDKLEKSDKKKSKKSKKEKRYRKSSEKLEPNPLIKEKSTERTPEVEQLPKTKVIYDDNSLTPPKAGAMSVLFESKKQYSENAAENCTISPKTNICRASPPKSSISMEPPKKSSTLLRSFIEMPQNKLSLDQPKGDSSHSKSRRNSVDKRVLNDQKSIYKDCPHVITQSPNMDGYRDAGYNASRYLGDNKNSFRKPNDNIELRSVATKMKLNHRTDNPFRRNRMVDKFDIQKGISRRKNSINVSSNSETYSDADDKRRRTMDDKERKEKDRKRAKYTSSNESGDDSRRKSKKKHKALKKKKKSRD